MVSSTRQLLSSSGILLAGVDPPARAAPRAARGDPWFDQPLDRVGDLELAARRRLDRAHCLVDRGVNRYTPASARSEGGSAGFSTSCTMSPSASTSATPNWRGSATCASRICATGGRRSPSPSTCWAIARDASKRSTNVRRSLLEHVVAEVHDEVVVAEEVARDQHAVREPERRVLLDVGDLDAQAGAVADGGPDLGRGGVDADDDAELLRCPRPPCARSP